MNRAHAYMYGFRGARAFTEATEYALFQLNPASVFDRMGYF